ncbi:MAG: phage tail tape measure protein [Pseudodesulfovibrio sp.]|uniref:phage tail tape measure protein n=1 Tax=Pseudodesulfovibrio sp. TaxID=2035812 RepID=UPI003D13693A
MSLAVGDLVARLRLDSSGFHTGLIAATRGANGATGALNALTSSSARTAIALAGVAYGAKKMYDGLKAAVGVGSAFESEMRKVQAVSRATEKQYEAMGDAALEAAKVTKFTATQSAEAMKYLAMAGFNANEAMAAMPSVLQLATAGMLDVASASDIATNIMSGFGMSVDELARANNVIVATATSANTNVEQLGEAMKYVAPVAKGMGYSIEETAGMLAVLANAGIRGSDAGTDLRQSFLRAAKAADAMGISGGNVIDVIERMKADGADVLDYQKVFGLIPLKSVLVLRDNLEAVKLQMLDIKKEARGGVAADTAATMERGVKASYLRLESATENMGVRIFDTFKVGLAETIDGLATFVNEVLTPTFSTMFEGWSTIIRSTSNFFTSINPYYQLQRLGLVEKKKETKEIEKQKGIYNDMSEKAETLRKVARQAGDDWFRLNKHYREGTEGAKDPGDRNTYVRNRMLEAIASGNGAGDQDSAKRLIALAEEYQKVEAAAISMARAIEGGWTDDYDRQIGEINTKLEEMADKTDAVTNAERKKLEKEKDLLELQNQYALLVEKSQLDNEVQLIGLSGAERKKKAAELELMAVVMNTNATKEQKDLANQIYDNKIKLIDAEKLITDQQKAQLLAAEQKNRLDSSAKAVIDGERQIVAAKATTDLERQRLRIQWQRLDAIRDYYALLKAGKIDQTQYNKLQSDAYKIEQDALTALYLNDSDRREAMVNERLKSLDAKAKSVKDEMALDREKDELKRQLLQNHQEYAATMAEINALDVTTAQRDALKAKADAWLDVANAAAIAKDEERKAAEEMESVAGRVRGATSAIGGALADSFGDIATGVGANLGELAAAMIKEVQLYIARLTAELTAEGLFHSIMAFVDQSNSSYHSAAAAKAYSGAATMGTIMAGSYLGSQFHAGITEVPSNLQNVSLVKGERVVDSATNKDLKEALKAGAVGGGGVTIQQHNTFAPGVSRAEIESIMPSFVDASVNAVNKSIRENGKVRKSIKAYANK